MKKTVKQLLNQVSGCINIFGEEPKLTYNGQARVPSTFSIILSIIAIIFTAFISYSLILQPITKTSPNLNIQVGSTPNYPKIDLEREKFYVGLITINTIGAVKNWDLVATFRAYITIKTILRDSSGLPTDAKFEKFDLEAKRCYQVKEKFKYLILAENSKFLLEHFYCFYPTSRTVKHYFLKGQPIEDIEAYLTLEVLPCSTQDPSKCENRAVLETTEYLVVYPNPDLDYSNYNNFLKWVPLTGVQLRLDPTQEHQAVHSIKSYEVFDQTTVLKKSQKKRDFFGVDSSSVMSYHRDENQLHCAPEVVGDPLKCSPYVRMVFRSSDKLETITRVYPDFIHALSEIGGFTELVLIFLGFLYAVYSCCFPDLKNRLKNRILEGLGTRGRNGGRVGYQELVSHNLDVVSLMDELNGLRVVNRAILEEHHLLLLPEVLKAIREEDKGRFQARGSLRGSVSPNRSDSDQNSENSEESKIDTNGDRIEEYERNQIKGASRSFERDRRLAINRLTRPREAKESIEAKLDNLFLKYLKHPTNTKTPQDSSKSRAKNPEFISKEQRLQKIQKQPKGQFTPMPLVIRPKRVNRGRSNRSKTWRATNLLSSIKRAKSSK